MTHPTDTPAAVTAALQHAAASWRMFTDEKGYNAPITTWETTTTPDGSPLVSGELAGRGGGVGAAPVRGRLLPAAAAPRRCAPAVGSDAARPDSPGVAVRRGVGPAVAPRGRRRPRGARAGRPGPSGGGAGSRRFSGRTAPGPAAPPQRPPPLHPQAPHQPEGDHRVMTARLRLTAIALVLAFTLPGLPAIFPHS